MDRSSPAEQARRGVQAPTAEDRRWIRDYEKSQHTRLERVHTTARAWLGVLTTILGLLGSVVLFKGGDLVTEVTANGAFRALLIVLISLVFTVAVLAVIFGGMATWGGLSSRTPPTVGTGHSWWRKRFFHVAQRLALTSGRQEVIDGKAAWEVYRDDRLESAERRRVYLNASRNVGITAAAFIAILAIVAVIAGTVSPVPSEVIVVHHGRLTCGPVGDSVTDTGVTQVIPVNSC